MEVFRQEDILGGVSGTWYQRILSLSLSLSLPLAANFSIAEDVLRWLFSRSSKGDAFNVLHSAAISLVQARREEAKSTKVIEWW